VSLTQRILAGLAVAICLAVGSVMVRSPTGLEKATKTEELAAVPQIPDEGDWLARSEEDLVTTLVHGPVKLRGMRSFRLEDQVALKEAMQRTEAQVRDASRAAKASGRLEADEREAVERALTEFAADLERFSVLR
jgi:hypothetical protein